MTAAIWRFIGKNPNLRKKDWRERGHCLRCQATFVLPALSAMGGRRQIAIIGWLISQS